MELKNKVLFVCMGNICRSPTAEGAFRSIVEKKTKSQYFEIDSAGTHAY
ncbi:MAG: low molecular weight phosphotyrosine protein phosphatase, partial [Gammaproteobacteria bacterium]|nr:low molecular weight phosphotyrosine protein phosphatase [Gammaproteobacteria bacterium]